MATSFNNTCWQHHQQVKMKLWGGTQNSGPLNLMSRLWFDMCLGSENNIKHAISKSISNMAVDFMTFMVLEWVFRWDVLQIEVFQASSTFGGVSLCAGSGKLATVHWRNSSLPEMLPTLPWVQGSDEKVQCHGDGTSCGGAVLWRSRDQRSISWKPRCFLAELAPVPFLVMWCGQLKKWSSIVGLVSHDFGWNSSEHP